MSKSKRQKKLQRTTQFETFEPRLLMTAQPASTPDFQVNYFVGGPSGLTQVATQVSGTGADGEAYYQVAPDAVRSEYGLTGAGQTVAVIDTGVAYDDAALGGGFGSGYKVVGGWDFAEGDANPYDDGPDGGHGTHVAGIIGSDDPNHLGVAPGVDLVALRVFTDSGGGFFSWVDNALRWVYDNRNSFRNPITTVNLSLGAEWNSISLPQWANLESDFRLLTQVGIFISVAAGNSFGSYGVPGLDYPADSPYVVPVMSEGADGTISSYSQRYSTAIAAPGENITSTVPDYDGDNNGVDDDWASYSGTSMAAAYMSGAAVIVRQALEQAGRTNIDENMINQLMRSTADSVYDPVTNATYLELDLQNAVYAALHTPVDKEGNTAAKAENVGSLDLRNTVSGSIDSSGDQDFFRFTAQHTGTVTISISRSAGSNTRWELVNANGTLHAVTGNYITMQVVAGKSYTFGVQGTSGTGDYNLTMQLTPAFTGLGMVNSKTIKNQRVGGEKWYRFQAARTGTVALTSVIPRNTGEVTIQVYNSSMQLLSTSTGQYTDVVSMAASQGSLYYVRIVGTNSKVQLQVACAKPIAAPGPKKASFDGSADGDSSSATAESRADENAAQNSSPAMARAMNVDWYFSDVSAGIHHHDRLDYPRAGGDGAALADLRYSDALAAVAISKSDEMQSFDVPATAASDFAAGDASVVDQALADAAGDDLLAAVT